MSEFVYVPIGIIRTPFKEGMTIPIQAAFSEAQGQIKVYPPFKEGLKDVEGFSHIIVLYHFHKAKKWKPLIYPFLDQELRGIFATRAPSRPNSIGLSILRLKKIESSTLCVQGVDILDKTPLLDIKPYIPQFDSFNDVRKGWLSKRLNKQTNVKSDDRFYKS